MFKIWPWSRIAELEARLLATARDGMVWYDVAGERLLENTKLKADNEILTRKLSEARKIEGELRFQLKGAHFRDPKTGRIMKKGAAK
jgi:regulator of replication initiation timing